jgi:hypothetical protein
MHHFLKFILFCGSTLHVSDGLSIHHQGVWDCTYIRHKSTSHCKFDNL